MIMYNPERDDAWWAFGPLDEEHDIFSTLYTDDNADAAYDAWRDSNVEGDSDASRTN
jgi:hypothetical protein